MKLLNTAAAAFALLSFATLYVAAQPMGGMGPDMMKRCEGMMQGGDHMGHMGGDQAMMSQCQKMMGTGIQSPAKEPSNAKEAFEAASLKMHEAMAAPLTGDADIDFLQGMIPHHQGAIDMAKILLKYGKDAEARQLAEQIIKAQEEEITRMRGMIARLKKS